MWEVRKVADLSNSWLPAEAKSSPMALSASMVGSSAKEEASNSQPEKRSPGAKKRELRRPVRSRSRWVAM